MQSFNRLFAIMTKPWVIVCYLGVVVLAFFYVDQSIAYSVHSLDLKMKCPQLTWLTHVGEGAIYIVLLFLLALFFRFVHRNKIWESRAWFLWLCVLIPYFVCGVLKVIIGRARPELLFDQHLYGFFGFHIQSPFWSFPSGHVTTLMGLTFGLSFLFSRYTWVFILAGFAVVLTRILLNHHYFSDVLATSYLTFIEVGLLVYVMQRKGWLLEAQGKAVRK